MVSSTHWLASAAGMAVLERGGNAFDAAVAAGFVLQVVEPHLNGPGGEVPILCWSAASERVLVVDGQGPAPAAATIGRFRDLGLDLVPGNGLLAACVPGAFGAWLRLLAEHGTLRLREVLADALGYAEGGFPLLERAGQAIASVAELFAAEWPTSAEVWLPGGRPPGGGGRFRNPALAATWRRLLAEAAAAGPDREAEIEAARAAFYEGFVAEAIERFMSTEVLDVTGRRHRGLLAGDDLAGWRAGEEAPARLDYAGWTVCKTGPWGQGPVLLQQLALLAGFDLAAMGLGSAEYVHTVVECAKLAFADREAWYGDPAAADVPLDGLLDPGYAARRRALVGEAASLELRPGSPDGRPPRLPALAGADRVWAAAGVGEPTLGGPGGSSLAPRWTGAPGGSSLAPRSDGSGDTCHVDVVDRHGNFVAATPSGGWLQSSPAVPGLGFCLGTRAQMFWLEEGLASSLKPARRPRTTLSPSLALRDGEPVLAFGTPGGDQQDQWPLGSLFLPVVHFGLDLQEAMDAPAFHTEHFPSSFWPREARPGVVVVEERVGPEVVEGLRRRGHRVVVDGPWTLGRTCAAGRDPASGLLVAAANPRGRQGYAVGR
jgi:gamma-glutamyltranspeptidase / glutathione hydrolase